MDAKSGTKFVLVVNKNMFIWDTVKEEIVDSFTLYSDIYSVAINKSSTRLACGCKDRLIRIFNTQSGLLWFTIGGHSGFFELWYEAMLWRNRLFDKAVEHGISWCWYNVL